MAETPKDQADRSVIFCDLRPSSSNKYRCIKCGREVPRLNGPKPNAICHEGPALPRRAVNFAKASIKHTFRGRPKSSPDEVQRRLRICRECPWIGRDRRGREICRHKKCGCVIERKARWADQQCPIGRWREPLLTLGMACYDDFYGVYDTLSSLVLYHGEVLPLCELLVVDNHPESRHGEATRKLCHGRRLARYVPFTDSTGTAQPRNEVFRQANGRYVLCMDSHVKFVPGSLKRLIDYLQENPGTNDLLQGPCITLSGSLHGTEQRPKWGGGAFGTWAVDERGTNPDNPPYEIWQQGMGVFCCRKKAWPGFPFSMRGFGGCETYIAESFRKRGDKVLCLPFLRWVHRFLSPDGPKDNRQSSDSLRNYLISFDKLNRPDLIEECLAHFAQVASHPRYPLTPRQYKETLHSWTGNSQRQLNGQTAPLEASSLSGQRTLTAVSSS